MGVETGWPRYVQQLLYSRGQQEWHDGPAVPDTRIGTHGYEQLKPEQMATKESIHVSLHVEGVSVDFGVSIMILATLNK